MWSSRLSALSSSDSETNNARKEGCCLIEISEFQSLIESIYFEKDSERGSSATFMWLSEEVGELSRAIRRGDDHAMREEFADVLAWTVSLASLCGVDMGEVVRKYASGCPKCSAIPCRCRE